MTWKEVALGVFATVIVLLVAGLIIVATWVPDKVLP